MVENLNATVSKSVEITWLHFINRCTMLADPVLASSFSGHFRWHYEASFFLISVHFMRHHHWPFGPLLLELNLLPFVTDRHCAWLISSASDSPRVVFCALRLRNPHSSRHSLGPPEEWDGKPHSSRHSLGLPEEWYDRPHFSRHSLGLPEEWDGRLLLRGKRPDGVVRVPGLLWLGTHSGYSALVEL